MRRTCRPSPADAASRMLRDLRDDWRALVARAEAENTELNRMDGYARIVTGVQALAAGLDLPPEMQAFVDEVRQRDARMVEGRRDELAFVQKAEAHCHRHPLLKWAAEERGVEVSDLPEHAAWLAAGAALEETGRRMQERPGFVGRIAAALGRIAQGFRLDEGERFREAAARHEAEAQRLGIDPGSMAGAARLVQQAEALGHHELPEAVRRRVEAWTPEPDPPAPERVHRPRPDHEEAGRRIEAFLRDCRHCLDAPPPAAETLDSADRHRLRRFAARGCGCSARARERSSTIRHASGCPAPPTNANGCMRPWTHLGRRCRGSARRAFVELSLSVAPQGLEAHPDPVDLPAWGALRDRAEALRGEAGLAPDAREAVDAVLARDARVEAEIAPVRAFLEEGALHLDRRAALDEGVRGLDPPSPDAIPAWRERSQEPSRDRPEPSGRVAGRHPGNAGGGQACRHAAASGPRPGGAGPAGDPGTARRGRGLPKTCGHGREASQAAGHAAAVRRGLPPGNRDGADPREPRGLAGSATPRGGRVARPRPELEGGTRLGPETHRSAGTGCRLGRSPQDPLRGPPRGRAPARREDGHRAGNRSARSIAVTASTGISWTGDEPLVAGDHIAWRAGGTVHHAVVAFPGEAGGMRASDTLLLRIAGPSDGTALDDAGRIVEIGAQALWEGGCARAAWSEEGLRQLEAARQYSVPSAACRLACSEPVEGDRIAWTEAAGRTGEVRTIEAVVATRTETPDGHEVALRTIRAFGPGAPEPGSSIRRTAAEVTARGCFRAAWSDEARRERILDPPKEEVQERTLTQRRERSHGGGIGM